MTKFAIISMLLMEKENPTYSEERREVKNRD
jgi:hypothetical protein